MGTLARRFLVLAALMFWQGGFTFYAAVVVPVGRQVIGTRQSDVTRSVTAYLNLAGAAALLPLAWDVTRCRDRTPRRRYLRWATWLGMALTLGALLWLHRLMVGQLRLGVSPAEPPFHNLHRLYLWVSTAQWACGLFYAGATLLAWRAEDRSVPSPGIEEARNPSAAVRSE
jgi:hypothetical protein